MEKKSGVGETNTSSSGNGGGIRSIGDAFQPNLAMGGGSYKVPIELPAGPGGLSPKLDLAYNTGQGNGPFGLGWALTVPFIERKRKSAFAPEGEREYTVSGAQPLVPSGSGEFVPFIGDNLQVFRFDGSQWTSTAPNLVDMRFGSAASSTVTGTVDGSPRVYRWLLDRMTFPGGRNIDFVYEADGTQQYLKTIRWSVFRFECIYETRPDPWSQFDSGFEIRTARRCVRIELHQDRLAPNTLVRTLDFTYQDAEYTQTSLLTQVALTGWRFENGAMQPTVLPPLTFAYTRFSSENRRIEKFSSNTVPPPALDPDVTLVDLRGTSLPGVLRMGNSGATYWENRGGLDWGPPQPLRQIPQGLKLSDPGVRFADLRGNGTADLVVGKSKGGGYYPNDPENGFERKRSVTLEPSFDLNEEGSYLLDLDGDRVADLLTFRNGSPMAFFNRDGESWEGPVSLAASGLPDLRQSQKRMRFADMNGDGHTDLVLLYSRRVVYFPYLGNGKWGAERVMDATPAFEVPRPDEDVYLSDVNGDGAADLILNANGQIRIYLNCGGERFGGPIILDRAPRLGVERFLLADMTGSGTLGFLFTSDSNRSRPHEYWYCDLLDGVKPYMLASIDNNAGLVTSIEYTTSSFERAADLREGIRWSGYLPFPVSVVKAMRLGDAVTGEKSVTEFRYHDGHFDGWSREYLGFARVDSFRTTGPNESPVEQRYYFHNRGASAADPAFQAGKGQPHRTELIDPLTGEVRQLEDSTWEARVVPGTTADKPAYLSLHTSRLNNHFEAGVVYESETIDNTYDAVGNLTREDHQSFWTDSGGNPQTDRLITETSFASHATKGLTSFESRIRTTDGAGRRLKDMRFHYDGPAFDGLALGLVENGFKTRQTEVALTDREIQESYGGVAPAILATLYRIEADADLGSVYVKEVGRARFDSFGNQVESVDPLGLRTVFAFDAESIHPVTVSEDGEAPRTFQFDPVAQQLARVADRNGHVIENGYDALGRIIAVSERGALPGAPSETYEYRIDTVPNCTIARIRIDPADAQPGHIKYDYFDGCARLCQTKLTAENGMWAAGKQNLISIHERQIGERDAYFSAVPDFDSVPPAGVIVRTMKRDFASRVVEETLFNGRKTAHRYVRNEVRFYGPDAADALDGNPATPPTRVSRMNAIGLAVSLVEFDTAGEYEQRRDYDPLRRLVRIVDSAGHTVLENNFDLWGNRIRITGAESAISTFVFDAANNEVQRTDADGRVLFNTRDMRGRMTELRTGGAAGPVIESYTYDAGAGANLTGRLARVVGSFGTVDYSYTPNGDVSETRRTIAGNPTNFTTGFAFNGQRKITGVRYPDGSNVTYTYSAAGMLTSIPGYVDTIEYGPTGKRTRLLYRNGVETRRHFTPGDYLIDEVLTQPAGGPAKFQHLVYQLDSVGQVASIDDLSNVPGKVRMNQTFEYDGRNRLVHATGSQPGFDFSYRYDELGNITFSGESFAEDIDYGLQTGDAAHPNRIVKRRAAANPEYTYDASGNLTADPSIGTLEYDERHRLTVVVRPDGTRIDYAYDHNDRRVKSTVTNPAGVETRYEVEGIFLVEPTGNVKVVFDEDRRLAVVPAAGDTLIHHLDRLGNVNVVTNLVTGAFVGNDEYTPYGRLFISMVIEPAFTFQGGRFAEGLDIMLLGARYYRPMLGRFLTPDPYLIVHQDKIPPLLSAGNLYAYAYCNPTNFTDPTGEIAPLIVALIIAAIVGAIVGAAGAAANGARTWDEWLVWIVGGIIGAVLTVLGFYGLGFWLGAGAAAGLAAAKVALVVWTVTSFLGVALTPLLDQSNSTAAWVFSWIIKLIRSPITTILGLFVVAGYAIAGKKVDFRRGALFVEVGPGMSAITIGAVVYTQSGLFTAGGQVRDDLAQHESYHTRTVAALGEIGFYLTYVTVAGIIGAAQAGGRGYLGLDANGCGNPFEKTAYTYFNPFNNGPNPSVTAADAC